MILNSEPRQTCGGDNQAANDQTTNNDNFRFLFHKRVSGLTKKAEPPPTRGVNRDSGTDSANGGWLRRLVRPQNRHNSLLYHATHHHRIGVRVENVGVNRTQRSQPALALEINQHVCVTCRLEWRPLRASVIANRIANNAGD